MTFRGEPHRFRFPWRSRREISDEIDAEISFHLDMRAEGLIAGGMDPDAARVEAEHEFGNVDRARHQLRRTDRHLEMARRRMERLGRAQQDLRFALRALKRDPGFAAAGVLTLALGIGAPTLLFSLVSAVLLHPLPYPNSEQLVAISHRYNDLTRTQVSPANFRDYATHASAFESLAAFTQSSTVYLGPERPERLSVMHVTDGFFRTLGAAPVLGRVLLPDDFAPDASPVIVLSEGVWRRLFGSDLGILGRSISLSDGSATVVGVYPDHADMPGSADLWQPFRIPPLWYADEVRGQAEMLNVIGRLRSTASLADARLELERIATDLRSRFPEIFPAESGWRITAVPLREAVVGETRTPLLILLGASLFVLLIACANVSNLLLARAISRRRDFAVRSALGGGLTAIARPLLLESLLLGTGGVILGAALAWAGARAFVVIAPDEIPLVEGVGLDERVLAFAVVAGLAASLLACVAPLRRLARLHPNAALGNDGRSGTAGTAWYTQRMLIVSSTALTFALLIGAGLMSRSLHNLSVVDLGFRPEGVATAEIDLSSARAPEAQDAARFFALLSERLESQPWIVAAGATLSPPMVGPRWKERFSTEDAWRGSAPTTLPEAEISPVTEGYFTAAGISILAGRGFGEQEREGRSPVAVVSRHLASVYWPGESAIGKRLALNPDWAEAPEWLTVIGVAGNVRTESVIAEPGPMIYEPLAQNSGTFGTLFIRSGLDLATVASLIRAEVRRLDPAVPVYNITSMPEIVSRTTASRRLAFWVAVAFAACSLLVAALGLYGVVSFLVRSRTQEFGVRIALGAQPKHILRLVLRQAGGVALIGLLLGLPLALGAARLLESFLFGVSPLDPVTYAGFALVTVATVAFAAYHPARCATRVDPQVALRVQ